MADTLAKLTTVFQDVFDDEELQISRSTNAGDVENWDSLSHVTLMLQVERSFGIRFSSSEVAKLQNVGELVDLIEKKVGN